MVNQVAMRKYLLAFLLFAAFFYLQGQSQVVDEVSRRKSIDSLKQLFVRQNDDTSRAKVLRLLGRYYYNVNKDSSFGYLTQAMNISTKANDFRGQTDAVRMIVDNLAMSGDNARALEYALHSLKLAEQSKDTMFLFWTTRAVWRSCTYMLEHDMTLEYARKAKAIVHSGYFKNEEEIKRYALMGYIHAMVNAYTGLNNWDSAVHYGHLAFKTAASIKDTQMLAIALHNLGDVYRKKGELKAAFEYYRAGISMCAKVGSNSGVANCQLGIARLFAAERQPDSALYYGKVALQTHQQLKSPIHELLATTFLSDVFAKERQIDSAYKYQSLSLTLKDSLFNQDKIRQVQRIGFGETLRLQQLEQERKAAEQRYKSRLLFLGISGGLLLIAVSAFSLYRIRQVKRENRLKAGFSKKIHETEMRALRAQMNPHFVFNCLNSINRYIVKSDHLTASSYLTKFSRLIRLILDNSASETISLDTEIQTLQLYIEMERLRFDHVFESYVEVDANMLPETIYIPSMLLQPYVENAIWHGLLNREDGNGKLWLRFRQPKPNLLIAEVEDNGIGRAKAKELKSKETIRNKSYGMKITEDRIFLINELYHTNANVQVDDLVNSYGEASGTRVTVEMPVRS